MRQRQSGESGKDKLWTKASARIGVVSAILGVGLNLINISSGIKGLHKPADPAKSSLLPPEIASEAPSIDASYISLSQELYFRLKGQRNKGGVAHSDFMAYPLVPNGIADDNLEAIDIDASPALETEYPDDKWFTRVTCLVVTNRGKRDAGSVSLELDKLSVDGFVNITESPGQTPGGYETVMRGKSHTAELLRLSIPTTLETGSGVIIPLFVGRYTLTHAAERRWAMISKKPLLPKSIRFTDPLTNKESTTQVRKMLDPVVMENGVEGRG